MALPVLNPDASRTTPIQQTAFSRDVIGRYVCNSWSEVAGNGGDPFDVVVIGAGMFGGYIADKLHRFGEDIGLRILILDAGDHLVSTHVQNLPRIGLGTPGLVAVTGNDVDPGPQAVVWGFPWHSSQKFPGLAYCIGGRSLYWGGWAPRMTDADLAQWPPEVVADLKANYATVEREIGVQPTTDYISGPLYDALLAAFKKSAPAGSLVGEAPLAVQGQAGEAGLFAFDKYSSAFLLIDAIREDIGRRGQGERNAARRLMLMPRSHVTRLLTSGNAVVGMEVYVDGQRQVLGPPLLSPATTVVLALSTIESTRLALESFPAPGMGANLMAHLRSNVTVRLPRKLFPSLPSTLPDLEAAALIVRGTTGNDHRFHFQVTAAAVQGPNPEQNMFSAIPDIDQLDRIRANQDPSWIAVTLRCIGELRGDKRARPGDKQKSWMNLTTPDPNQDERFGNRRAWVNLEPSADDLAAWDDMERKALDLTRAIAGGPGNVQYWYGGQWNAKPPAVPLPEGDGRDAIGSTHHESGTLWMGQPGKSLTDVNGKFHHVRNAYVAGPALFPTAGSANPSLTGLALARRSACAIVADHTVASSATVRPLLNGGLAGWQMAGGGSFLPLFGGSIVETQGGLGLLWYAREVFRNFVLRVDWLAFEDFDNSGVFVRFPALNASDPANDWKLPTVQGYEIQIDDRGVNPGPPVTLHDPAHQTGAVYALAPSSKVASKPVGQWNTFEIQATRDRIKVTLNGSLVTDYATDGSRPAAGHIGLQNHTGKVQFRNVMIRSLPD